MRTKLLLTAVALGALFTSCSKEEFAPVNVETSERAVVENVSFTFNGGATTRLGFGTDYYFEAGDQIGACLMDEITGSYGSSAKWYQRFNLVDYIQTNYKFTRDAEGNWETEAKLCEGNYFMAYPYNMNKGLREAYEFSYANQTIKGTDDASLKEAFVNNTAFVGYAAVRAHNNDNESVAVNMTPVFESTGFVLHNTGTQSYNIEKIVLSGEKVSSYAVVKPSNVAGEYSATTGEFNFDIDDKGVLDYTFNKRIDVALTGGNTVESNGSIRVIVMTAPAKIATDGDAILEIHTNKGLIRGIKLNQKYEAGNSSVANSPDAENVLTDKALANLGKADKVEITFDDTSVDAPNTMEIYNTDELYRFIRWNRTVTNTVFTAKLKANVTLTAEIYNILKNEYAANGSSLIIDGSTLARANLPTYNVTINADVAADAIELVKFQDVKKVIVKGTQNTTKAFKGVTEVEVNKDAVLNVTKAFDAKITNKGTVNVAIAYKKNEGAAYYTVKELVNKAAVTVDGYALYTALTNSGTLTNNTTLNVSGNNTGVIDNYGVLAGSLVNKEYVKNVQNPTINNYGAIENVTNDNVIVMKDVEASIKAANGFGEIDNTIQSAYIMQDGIKNTVTVTLANVKASELTEIAKDANATKAYISGVLTVDPAEDETVVKVSKLTKVVANDDLTITGKGKVQFLEHPEFVVAGNTVTKVKNGSHLSIRNGVLKVNGKLVIENNAAVTCGAYSGTIDAFGKLNKTTKVIVAGAECTPVATQSDLNAALANGENVYIDAPGDYDFDWYGAMNGATDELTISGAPGVKVEFVTGAQGQAINISRYKNLTIENVEITAITGTRAWGMLRMGTDAGAGAGVYTVRNCTFTGVGTQGIYINESNSGAVYNIENCTFKGDFGVEGAITIQNNDNVDFTVNVKGCTFSSIPSTSHKVFVHYAYDGWTLNTDVDAYWKANQ